MTARTPDFFAAIRRTMPVLVVSAALVACGGNSATDAATTEMQAQRQTPVSTPVPTTPTAATPAPQPPAAATPAPAAGPAPASSPTPVPTAAPNPTALDQQLRRRIDALGLTGDPARNVEVPDIASPLAQLGMRLFFSRSLGGDLDTACASCHHPALGGADALSLPVGVAAADPALLGRGREAVDGVLRVPRNAPTTFNVALQDRALFDDGRVESLAPRRGANGAGGGIRTPDSAFGVADPNAGDTLPAAQSRFPIVAVDEMLGSLLPGASHDDIRERLASRIGNYGDGRDELPRNEWLPLFEAGFGVADTAEHLVTDASIAAAIAAYERSQLFVDTAWRDYVAGNLGALSDPAKRGALLFLTPANQNGAGCLTCHRGDRFSDDRFHSIAFPQIGPGKGDGAAGDDDFGRARETGNAVDRYAFRTPSLLNVALTAPYGHAGAYATLTDVVRHYRNPRGEVTAFFNRGGWCQLAQFSTLPPDQCAALYPNARANSDAALAKLQADRDAGRLSIPDIRLSDAQVADIVAFLRTLTDRCVVARDCRAQWVPPRDGGPDTEQLDAVNRNGAPL